MNNNQLYTLPHLSFDFNALEPHISQKQLQIHYEIHHKAYVDGANKILANLKQARQQNAELDFKAALKALSFNIGGHLLHSLFWQNLKPAGSGNNQPQGVLTKALNQEFSSIERFKNEFSQTAQSVEGSGWAALAYCKQTKRPIIMQIEKHNSNVYPILDILLVLDVFEHAYYLDYQNARGKFIEAFWQVVNWDKVEERLEQII